MVIDGDLMVISWALTLQKETRELTLLWKMSYLAVKVPEAWNPKSGTQQIGDFNWSLNNQKLGI